MIGRFKFIGRNGSMGLITNNTYKICYNSVSGRIRAIIYDGDDTKYCPYNSLNAFRQNWVKVESDYTPKYILVNGNGLVFIESKSDYEFSCSSVSDKNLYKYGMSLKEAQDIIAKYYSYLTKYDSCYENRLESILTIKELD